jgi:hypothetical protein
MEKLEKRDGESMNDVLGRVRQRVSMVAGREVPVPELPAASVETVQGKSHCSHVMHQDASWDEQLHV